MLALNLAAASVGAFVLVNTVVLVRSGYGRDEGGLAMAMAAFGAGSMAAALILPRLLDHAPDRKVMLVGAQGLVAVAFALGGALWVGGSPSWTVFLLFWLVIGLFYSSTVTPSGRLLRRSAHAEDRAAVFAAHFALSHACWLVSYPLAGWAGQALGMGMALLLLAGLGLVGIVVAWWVWPAGLCDAPEHTHPDLPEDHPHLRAYQGPVHAHPLILDDDHRA
jgi:predicted MFS family arabinose efflux permease